MSNNLNHRVGQVQVIPFRPDETGDNLEVLILKRNEERGGFWQPVTGGIHPEETVREAAYRELNEETGATTEDCVRMFDDGYTFTFTDIYQGQPKTFTEHVVGMLMHRQFEVTISDEHEMFQWASPLGALALFKYDSTRDALNHYLPIVTQGVQDV